MEDVAGLSFIVKLLSVPYAVLMDVLTVRILAQTMTLKTASARFLCLGGHYKYAS